LGISTLVRLKATRLGLAEQVATARVRQAVEHTLEAIRSVGARVEVNTSALRKGIRPAVPR
jgi:ABC-type Fe3+-citrate transport system substrate-binding protein